MLSNRSKRTRNRAAKAFRMAASTLRNSQTALGAFYRRIKSRIRSSTFPLAADTSALGYRRRAMKDFEAVAARLFNGASLALSCNKDDSRKRFSVALRTFEPFDLDQLLANIAVDSK